MKKKPPDAHQLDLFGLIIPEADVTPNPEPFPAAKTGASLAELAQECAACTRCPLHEGRTNSVFADGNPTAKLMVIGEGPGRNEDEQGIPFVGRAGKLLTKMLESVGFNRQADTYICNIVKCRPPNNRAPERIEIDACFPFLEAQIELVKPRIILLAGATAVKGVLKDLRPISKIRGQWLEWRGIQVMPIFHPSFLLRNESREVGSPKWLTWQDLKAIHQKFIELP